MYLEKPKHITQPKAHRKQKRHLSQNI